MRETSASDAEGAEPCNLYYTYDELTINTDILGVASIQGGSSSLKNKVRTNWNKNIKFLKIF